MALFGVHLTRWARRDPIVVSCDEASCHVWVEGAILDREYGVFGRTVARMKTNNNETVQFTPGFTRTFHIVLWHANVAMFWTEPVDLGPGDSVEIELPITWTFQEPNSSVWDAFVTKLI